MKKNDIIIGLPALTGKLYPFLQALLEKANSEFVDSERTPSEDTLHNLENEDTSLRASGELVHPWTKVPGEPAIEDEETPLPVNFGEPLTFLGKSREQAIADYQDLRETHVSKELKDETPIMEYMEKRAVKAFVPSNWTGINGIEPLKLKWLTTLPARKKPRARLSQKAVWCRGLVLIELTRSQF